MPVYQFDGPYGTKTVSGSSYGDAYNRYQAWEAYMDKNAPNRPRGLAAQTRYDELYDLALQQQLGAAEGMYGAAGQRGNVAAAQMRSGAMRQAMGGLGDGGLAARGALMGAGETSWGAGQEGARMGAQDRLAAAQSYMLAQQQRARYEQARNEAWRQRFLSDQERARAADEAYRQSKARQENAAWQTGGTILSAGSAGMAAGISNDRGPGPAQTEAEKT